MRDFELNRNIDAVQVMSKNQPKPGDVTPQALYVPVAAYPVIVGAYVYIVAATQVALGFAYWVAAGYQVKIAP